MAKLWLGPHSNGTELRCKWSTTHNGALVHSLSMLERKRERAGKGRRRTSKSNGIGLFKVNAENEADSERDSDTRVSRDTRVSQNLHDPHRPLTPAG